MKNAHINYIAAKADKLAVEYNKTKDPSIRDQWFKLVKTLDPGPSLEQAPSHKKTLDTTYAC
jgi:hypothetical protein